MNTTLPPRAKAESGAKLRRRIIVIYETAAGREKALGFCDQLTVLHRADAEFEVQWLSFAQLNGPRPAGETIEQAATADWLVFAVDSAGDFPHNLKLWMERWLGKRSDREGTLVGLICGASNPCELACLKEVHLRHVAHRAGMDYLTQMPPLTQWADAGSLATIGDRADRVTAVLDQILHTAPPTAPLL